jgi:hypothetical protein
MLLIYALSLNSFGGANTLFSAIIDVIRLSCSTESLPLAAQPCNYQESVTFSKDVQVGFETNLYIIKTHPCN